jgi:uncharacterized protein YegL
MGLKGVIRGWVLGIIRLCILVPLILALLKVPLWTSTYHICRIYLVDISKSTLPQENLSRILKLIQLDLDQLLPQDRVGLATFASKTTFLVPPVSPDNFDLPAQLIKTAEKASYTSITDAITTVLSHFPEGYAKEIFLISDGNEVGNIDRAILKARSHGVRIHTYPIGPQQVVDLRVVSVEAPWQVSPQEKFTVSCRVISSIETDALVNLYRDSGEILQTVRLHLLEDLLHTVRFPGLLWDPSGPYLSLRVGIEPIGASDDFPQNNCVPLTIVKRGPQPEILSLSKTQGSNLERLLKAIPEVRIETSCNYQDPYLFDLVILNDFPVDRLTSSQMESLRRYVQEGGGLLIVGGPSAFGLGGYQNKIIEEVSPLWALPDERFSVTFVLDTSGSMGTTIKGLGKTKLAAAVEAILSSLKLLEDRDTVSVVSFSDRAATIAPQRPLKSSSLIPSKLYNLRAYGPTSILPGLKAGLRHLLSPSASGKRHVLLLTDGKSMEEKRDFTRFGKRLKQMDISITVIATGDDPDIARLQELGGNIHHLRDFSLLEEVLKKDIVRNKGLTLEGKLGVSAPFQHMIFKTDLKIPPVDVCHRTTPKRDTIVLLKAEKAPLLAFRFYARGKTAALTTSLEAGWAKEWLRWDNLSTFISSLVSYIRREARVHGLNLQIWRDGSGTTFEVSIISDLSGHPRFKLYYTLLDSGQTDQVGLKRVGYNRFTAHLPQLRGALLFRIVDETLGQTKRYGEVYGVLEAMYPFEFSKTGINNLLLKDLADRTGGKFIQPNRIQGKSFERRETKVPREGQTTFLLCSIGLFIIYLLITTFWRR